MKEGYRHERIEKKHGVEFEYTEREAVETLDKPVRTILEQLRQNIERGTYKVIIGDDASGRIPALIIATALKKIYAAHGLPSPRVRFVAGTRFLDGGAFEKKKASLSSYIHKMKTSLLQEEISPGENLSKPSGGDIGSPVLVVTDYISTGSSLKPLIDSLKENGIAADFATIRLNNDFDPEGTGFGVVAVGEIGGDAPAIYNQQNLSGVTKNPENLFATPAIPPKYITADKYLPFQQKINATRDMVADIAERAAEKFLSSSR